MHPLAVTGPGETYAPQPEVDAAVIERRMAWLQRHRGWLTSLTLAAPAMLFLTVFFLAPMALLLLQSVESGSLAHYEKALTDVLYLRVLGDTLLIAAYVTIASLLLGYPVAYFLASAPPRLASVGMLLLLLPFWTSILVRTYGWMALLGRNGVVNRALMSMGVVDVPLPLSNNQLGVVIGMIHVLLPYMVFPLYAVMRRVDNGLVVAAQGMGASGFAAFRHVYLPLTLPGILAGVTLVYSLSIGFFITPALLGGGKVPMMAVLIEEQVRTFLNWGFAAALSAVLLFATLMVYLGLRKVLKSDMQWN